MSEGGDGGRVDSIWNMPGLGHFEHIPHYYGSYARQLLIGAATLMLIGAPLYGSNLRVEFPFMVVGALVIVALAALTSPKDPAVSMGSTIASGVGVLVYGTWGILQYDTSSPISFILRLTIAIIFLSSFYFSLKTVRAFRLGQIGKHDVVDEFETEAEKERAEKLERETMVRRDTL